MVDFHSHVISVVCQSYNNILNNITHSLIDICGQSIRHLLPQFAYIGIFPHLFIIS
jgi:hypothetical protein